jgi:hypothetical protein
LARGASSAGASAEEHVLVGEDVDRDHRRAALDEAHAVGRHRRQRQIALAREPLEEASDAGRVIDDLIHVGEPIRASHRGGGSGEP